MAGLRHLIREIHRRSLWQVMAIYIGASWAVLEAADVTVNRLSLPEWVYGVALLLLLVGLPVVLATAFIQEGIAPASSEPAAPTTGADEMGQASTALPARTGIQRFFTWRNAIGGGVLAFALWGVASTGLLLFGARGDDAAAESSSVDRKSVAVLPFANLSPDPDDAYFTDGVHDEILTQLAKISGLRLISRTSVMGYREAARNLKEIAGELDVRYILEGSVRRFGDRVRITAQLIDAETDEHLWAESYERGRADLFAIQADVAHRIAEALQTELSPAEMARISVRVTENTEAHDQYLRAREFNRIGGQAGREARGEAWRSAIESYERAVELDPSFAAGWAGLAYQHLRQHWYGYDRTPERLEDARAALERAEELDPDLAEVRIARGYYLYWGLRDYAGAVREYRAAVEILPGDAELPNLIGYVLRRQGRLLEAAGHLSRGLERNPRNASLAEELGNTYRAARVWEEAEQYLDIAIELAPDYPDAYMRKAELHVSRGGDTEAARSTLQAGARAGLGADLLFHLYRIEILGRRWDAALEQLGEATRDVYEYQYELYPIDLLAGLAYAYKGDRTSADSLLQSALETLERLRTDTPDDYQVTRMLGITYAALGRKDEAALAAERAVELMPMTLDAWLGSISIEDRAWTYAIVGEIERAIDDLEFLIDNPTRSWITPPVLRLDPRWDSLRDHDRFKALLDR